MKYLEHKVHEGKTEKYNLVTVNCENMDEKSFEQLKADSLRFSSPSFESRYKKYCLDLKKVNKLDKWGLRIIKIFNRQNIHRVTLSNCGDNIVKALDDLKVPSYTFDYVKSIDEL